MNIQETTLLVSIASAVGTMVAAIIYYATFIEIRKQRLDRFTPSLFIDRATFFVQGVVYEDDAMPYKWNEGQVEFEKFYTDFEPYGGVNRFYLKLYNIGSGIAKNVEVKFSYEMDEFIERINLLGEKGPEKRRIKIEKGPHLLSLSPLNKDYPFNAHSYSLGIRTESVFNNIIPITISKEVTLLDLPTSFMELFNIYIHYIRPLMGRKEVVVNPPILTVEISYQNVDNKDLRQSFTISTDMGPFGGGTYGGQLIVSQGE